MWLQPPNIRWLGIQPPAVRGTPCTSGYYHHDYLHMYILWVAVRRKTHQDVNPILEVETMVMKQSSKIYLNDLGVGLDYIGNEKNISKQDLLSVIQ